MALSPAWGQVTISLATRKGVPVGPGAANEVRSRLTCGFTAAHADGRPRAWHWTLEEPDGGRFVSSQGRARMAYQAPFVLAPRVVHVRVTDPATGESAVFTLRVLPREGVPHRVQAGLNTVAQPQVFGPVVDVPTATGFAGNLPGALGEKPLLHDLVKIQLVADPDPALRDLHGKCLAVAADRLYRLDGPWSMTPIRFRGRLAADKPFLEAAAFPAVRCVDVSVRPAGSTLGDRRRIVVVLSRSSGINEETYICGMDPDGTVWPIAGSSQRPFRGPRLPPEGPGPSVFFSHMVRTELDVSGNILVAEYKRIRRIDAEGRVTLVAGGGDRVPAAQDGTGSNASFACIVGFALDAASGDLYVSDREAIRRIRPDGTVTTVLGALGENRPIPLPPAPARIAEGVPCLESPRGLACQGGILFVCEPHRNQVLAFNLGDRTLYTLLAADPKQPVRLGPLPAFAREKALADCVNLPSPNQLAVMDRRVLVVAGEGFLNSVIVQFDLPHGVFGETERERKE
ncbi:MAG: hypothetical protein HGA66_13345 [Holophaga sp.]|nr:hypothetical protein [Holophaga sp.]